jgi:hypothetical protein
MFAAILLMAVFASFQARAADIADISGTWIMTVTTSMGGGSPTFTFIQKGEHLTGTYKGQLGEQPVTGTIKGNDVSFEFQGEAQGQSFTVTYTGKLAGSSMSGEVALGQFAQGTFTGRKQ